uniref:GYF domain-containing protein n=1 Tax=Roseovarius indicus TaxID=540747 RepID=UPI003B51C60E
MVEDDYPPVPKGKHLTAPISHASTMPHPLDAEWHVSVDENVYGPFSGHDLKLMVAEGRLEYDSMVQKIGGADQWINASEDRTLAKLFVPVTRPPATKEHAVFAGDGAQVVTVNNTIATPSGYIGEKPIDKSPFLAAILSLFIVGIGQMYNGEVGKGILMLFGCIVLWTVFLGWIINIWSIVDAYSVANRKHDAYDRWMEANAAAARAQATG